MAIGSDTQRKRHCCINQQTTRGKFGKEVKVYFLCGQYLIITVAHSEVTKATDMGQVSSVRCVDLAEV